MNNIFNFNRNVNWKYYYRNNLFWCIYLDVNNLDLINKYFYGYTVLFKL